MTGDSICFNCQNMKQLMIFFLNSKTIMYSNSTLLFSLYLMPLVGNTVKMNAGHNSKKKLHYQNYCFMSEFLFPSILSITIAFLGLHHVLVQPSLCDIMKMKDGSPLSKRITIHSRWKQMQKGHTFNLILNSQLNNFLYSL